MNPRRLILLILILGALLRVIGIPFGLPGLYHADEPNVVNRAVAYGSGDLNPHYFQIPPLVSTLLFFEFGLYYLLGVSVGVFSSLEDFATVFFRDPSIFYLIGRISLGVIPATLSLWFLYRLGERFFSKEAGLWASFFLAINFLHVRDSHYVYLDIPLVFVLIIGYFPILLILEKGRLRDYLLGGLGVGLAAATKYNGALIAGSLWAAHLLRMLHDGGSPVRWIFDGRLFLAASASLAGYSLLNPFTYADWNYFLKSFSLETHVQGYIGWSHHLVYSLLGALGPFLLLFSIVAVISLVIQRDPKGLLLISFPVIFFLALAIRSQVHERYVLPLLPFLFLAAGLFLERLRKNAFHLRLSRTAFTLLILVLTVPTFIKTAFADYLFLQPDTRNVAKSWIEAQLPHGARMALDHTFFAPVLLVTKEGLEERLERIQGRDPNDSKRQEKIKRLISLIRPEEKRFRVYTLKDESRTVSPFIFTEPSLPFSREALLREGIGFVVIHRIFPRWKHPEFYEALRNKDRLLARFSPYRDETRPYGYRDQFGSTGLSFEWRELVHRKQMGEIIEVYQLSGEP